MHNTSQMIWRDSHWNTLLMLPEHDDKLKEGEEWNEERNEGHLLLGQAVVFA
jgi:hypothetical protein